MNTQKIVFLILGVFFLVSCGNSQESSEVVQEADQAQVQTIEEGERSETNSEIEEDAVEDLSSEASLLSGEVEIMLSNRLDGILSEYCLDIAGGNQDVDPANGIQAHTCYSYQGDLGTDQVFDAGEIANNTLSMPIYDVCVSLSSFDAGTEVELTDCANGTAISFSGNGTISPLEAPEMCFTAAQDSRMGR